MSEARAERRHARTAIGWARLALAGGCLVLVLKLAAYQWTGSVVVLSDALEGLVNIVAGAFMLYAVSFAVQPADDCHPYGHGKVEFLSAALEGGLISAAALAIAYQAGIDIWHGPRVHAPGAGALLVLIAAVINGLLGWALIRTGRRVGSVALEADGHHLVTDLVTSLLAILGLGLVVVTGMPILDPLLGLVAAAWVLWAGSRLLRRAIAGMMDEADPRDLEALEQALRAIEEPLVLGYRDLRSRHQGSLHHVEVELLMPPETPVGQAAAASRRVVRALEVALESAQISCRVAPREGPAEKASSE